MLNIFEREFQGRVTVNEAIMNDPERLHRAVKVHTLFALLNAKHYGGYNLAFGIPAIDNQGNGKILTSAVYKPFNGSLTRICAEQAALLGAAQQGDQFFGTGTLISPEPRETIGCRHTNFQQCCGVCTPVVLSVSPNMIFSSILAPTAQVLGSLASDSKALVKYAEVIEPGEAFPANQIDDYHAYRSDYPEMPMGHTATEVALGGFCTTFPATTLVRPRQVTFEEVYNYPVAA